MLSSLKVDGNAVNTVLSYTITNVQKDTTITAEFSPISYTISYDLDGGTGSNPTSYTIETESFTLNEPTREGYTFTGWTGTGLSSATTSVTINKGSTGNRNYTANWEVSMGTPNEPVITTGLTPVNWSGSSWVTTTKENWDYDYNSVAESESNGTVAGNGNGKWANAQTADGSLYVWIPRYTYKITSGYHEDVDSWNADEGENKTGKIEIIFSNGTTDTVTSTTGLSKDGYIKHPAFTFGNDELKGIWVAKYEASQGTTTSEVSVPTSSTSVAKSIPNVISWTNISVSKMFDYAYNTYRSVDSHLMKNVEWGAVAYLTNAIGRIPYINNSSSFITGNAGGSQDASSASGTTNAWNTANGVKASTTHNVYGIYDMSGGAYEYVAAYYTGGNSTYLANDVTGKKHAGSLYKAANNTTTAKYVDAYSSAYTSDKTGDAVYETSGSNAGFTSWDGEPSYLPDSSNPIFSRGGCYNDVSRAGTSGFTYVSGVKGTSIGFRVVLVPGTLTVTTSNKTTNSFVVSAILTGASNDNLTYTLYVDGSAKETKTATSGTTVTFSTVTGLSEYTTYSYYVTVTDGKATTSSTGSIRTKCSGTSLTNSSSCSISSYETRCSNCNGYGGTEGCTGTFDFKNPNYTWTDDQCSKCGKNYTITCYEYVCSENGEDGHVSIDCRECPACGKIYYYCGHYGTIVCSSKEKALECHEKYGLECTVCNGTGKTTAYKCSSHNVNLTNITQAHCSHGYTYMHD